MAMLLAALPAGAEEGAPPPAAPKSLPGAPVFLHLAPINVPVIRGNNVTEQVGISLSLELMEGKSVDDIDESERRKLQDAFISDVYGIFQRSHGMARPIDASLIKARLQQTADRILGSGVVKDVLIERLFEQPR